MNFSKFIKNVLAFVFGIVLSVILVGFMEVFARLNKSSGWVTFNPKAEERTHQKISLEGLDLPHFDSNPVSEADGFDDPDDYNGMSNDYKCASNAFNTWWFGSPNCKSDVVLKKVRSGKTIYRTTYSFDELALRNVPDANRESAQAAIFLGCSFTFGEGVADDQTFANQIAKKHKDLNAYIIASPGFGPNQLLHIFKSNQDVRLPKLKSKDGFAVITILSDHIDRTFNSTNRMRNNVWSDATPFYESENGVVSFKGTFGDNRPFNFIYQLVSKSELANLIHFSLPLRNRDLFSKYADLMKELKIQIEKHFGIKKFSVVVFPGEGQAMPKVFLDELMARSIEVIDLSEISLKELTKSRAHFFGNGHPSPEAHKVLSEILYKELVVRGNIKQK